MVYDRRLEDVRVRTRVCMCVRVHVCVYVCVWFCVCLCVQDCGRVLEQEAENLAARRVQT